MESGRRELDVVAAMAQAGGAAGRQHQGALGEPPPLVENAAAAEATPVAAAVAAVRLVLSPLGGAREGAVARLLR